MSMAHLVCQGPLGCLWLSWGFSQPPFFIMVVWGSHLRRWIVSPYGFVHCSSSGMLTAVWKHSRLLFILFTTEPGLRQSLQDFFRKDTPLNRSSSFRFWTRLIWSHDMQHIQIFPTSSVGFLFLVLYPLVTHFFGTQNTQSFTQTFLTHNRSRTTLSHTHNLSHTHTHTHLSLPHNLVTQLCHT